MLTRGKEVKLLEGRRQRSGKEGRGRPVREGKTKKNTRNNEIEGMERETDA